MEKYKFISGDDFMDMIIESGYFYNTFRFTMEKKIINGITYYPFRISEIYEAGFKIEYDHPDQIFWSDLNGFNCLEALAREIKINFILDDEGANAGIQDPDKK